MPYKDKGRRREWQQLWRARHKAMGLCGHCNQPAVRDQYKQYRRCAYHLYRQRLQDKAYRSSHHDDCLLLSLNWRRKMLQEGNCYTCGAPLTEGEEKYCMSCKANAQSRIRGVLRAIINKAVA